MRDFPEVLYAENSYAPEVSTSPREGASPIYRVRVRAYGDFVLYAFRVDADGGPYLWIRKDGEGFVSCVPPQTLRMTLRDIDELLG